MRRRRGHGSGARRVHTDETRHVAFAWTWFQKLKPADADDWEIYLANVHRPGGPERARGATFDALARHAAGIAPERSSTAWQPRPDAAGRRAPMSGPRWILGNLDCEDDWARMRAGDSGRWPRSLPLDVLQRASLFATLLRVYADDGDVALDAGAGRPRVRARRYPGLPDVTYVHGPDAKPPAKADVLAWAAAPPSPEPRERMAIAARVNDRVFALRLAERFGVTLAGSQVIRSVEELLATEVAGGPWVAKAPHGTAGRNRVLGRGRQLEDNQRGALGGLLKDHGRLVLQPWVRRTLDFGMWLEPAGDGRWLRGITEQVIDARGRFQGVIVSAEGPDLEAGAFLETLGTLVRDTLDQNGYEGPFGVDGFEYEGVTGARLLMPLLEINARRTFGMVAHALVERVAKPYWGDDAGRVALRFGRAGEPETHDSRLPLLGAADDALMLAWLERMPPQPAPEVED